jgi:hypothetical protein
MKSFGCRLLRAGVLRGGVVVTGCSGVALHLALGLDTNASNSTFPLFLGAVMLSAW